jgi:DNA polymerase III alpha subunit (gram-positive type)
MDSPLRRILVFDLETGGLNYRTNSITEMAGVIIDTETLNILEEFSVTFLPYMDLRNNLEEPIKEARRLFTELATPGSEGQEKSLLYAGKEITLKSLNVLADDIEIFNEYLEKREVEKKRTKESGRMFTYKEYLELQETEYSDISRLYFNSCYNPEALEATHITIDMLVKEGIPWQEAGSKICELIKTHTVGTYKPILAGHNIKSFDMPFMEKLFIDCGFDFSKLINSLVIDTLEWARLRWFSLSSFSLGVCSNELGLTLKEAHRALPDTIANANFLIKLLKSMRGEGGSSTEAYVRRKFDMNF